MFCQFLSTYLLFTKFLVKRWHDFCHVIFVSVDMSATCLCHVSCWPCCNIWHVQLSKQDRVNLKQMLKLISVFQLNLVSLKWKKEMIDYPLWISLFFDPFENNWHIIKSFGNGCGSNWELSYFLTQISLPKILDITKSLPFS